MSTESQVRVLRVVRREVVSTSFVRIVLGPERAGDPFPFVTQGADQWFRLFLPAGGDPTGSLELPLGPADGWYQRWLAMPEETRAVVRNYTMRAARTGDDGWEIDVDFVLHRDADGRLEGTAATWSATVEPGGLVGLLGQGTIFDVERREGRLVAVCDETGLPGLEAALRDLPSGLRVDAVVEVPVSDDVRELPGAASCRWAVRERGATWRDELPALAADDAIYAVGGQDLALGARQHARERGVPDERIAFCSYWRRDRKRDTARAATRPARLAPIVEAEGP